MVKYCVCAGCTNSSLTGHRVHCFPNSSNNEAVFRAWLRFVQVNRADFSAASVTKNVVVCSAHFRQEDYVPGDMMESRMGFRCLDRVRLLAGAVPSIHTTASSAPLATTTTTTTASASASAAGGSDNHGSVNSARRKRELSTLLANTIPVVKIEEDLEETRPVTPEPAVQIPKKIQLLNHSYLRSKSQNRPEPPVLDRSSSTETRVHHEYTMMSSPKEVEQETLAAASVQSSENGKESGIKHAACQKPKSQDEWTSTNQSANKENRGDEDEEFSTSLSVGDGHYLVDLGSSSEFIVDEECILQLFKSCRECNRQCTVRKRVKGLKLVVNQACCYCESRFKWTNLPDDDDGDFQTNGKDTAHGQTNSAKQ